MDQVNQIRERIDIVALMSEFLQLKKAGRNFKTNCPFHNEKTPSLIISPERQIWKCFGCQKGGDCFTFLMEYERLEFPEALRILAKRAGIELSQKSGESTAVSSKKEKIYAINHLVGEYYHFLLTKHPIGKNALEYLQKERRLLPQTINTFRIGFAPNTGNSLAQYLMKKKEYTKEELYEAGLITIYDNRVRDFFRERIMFPLFDHRDNAIGFSGRVLNPKIDPKYINTPEKLVYHKGQVFFNLNRAKEAIKRENQVIIMEGEFDVIASFQEGITNVVAIKGTALTEEQVALIGRYAQKVTLCLDMDEAGQKALLRSVPILEKKGLRITVITPPSGKDADESIKENPLAFKKSVKNDIEVYDFLLSQTVLKYNKQSVDGKRKISELLLPLFSQIQNEIVKEHYLTRLSREIGTSFDSLQKEIEKMGKREVVKETSLSLKTPKSREEILESYLLALLVQDTQPLRHAEGVKKLMQVYKFHIPVYQKLLDAVFAFCKDNENFNTKQFILTLPSEIIPAFDQCFLFPLPKFTDDVYQKEVTKVAEELFGLFVHEQITIMGETIKDREKDGNLKELEALQKELTTLVSLLKKK